MTELDYIRDVCAIVAGRARKDVLDDFNSVDTKGLIQGFYSRGYTVSDAAQMICLTSQAYDEDWACAKQKAITDKYEKVNR